MVSDGGMGDILASRHSSSFARSRIAGAPSEAPPRVTEYSENVPRRNGKCRAAGGQGAAAPSDPPGGFPGA